MNKSKICIRFIVLFFVNVSFYFNVVNTKDEEQVCKKSVEVSNGKCTSTDNGNNGLSHECTLTCDKYYQAKPSISMVCGFKKQWIGAMPSCERVLCDKPIPPKNGRAKCDSTSIANKYSSCILKCENQYQMSNEKDNKDELTIQCYLDRKENPTWDSFPSECKSSPRVLCDKPSPPKNGRAKCASTNIANKYSSCILTCENQYKMSNEKDDKDELTIQCYLDSNGKPIWDSYPSECKSSPSVKCEPIKNIIKGSAKCTVDNRQTFSCIIECDPGYAVRRGEPWPAIDPVCYRNDKGVYVWEKYYKECFLTPCKKPNLKWPLDGKCTDHHCQLWCATGYHFEGKNKMDCFNDVWSEPIPICKNPNKFPIDPEPCKDKTIEKARCHLIRSSMKINKKILKIFDIKCYNWKKLYNERKDYIRTQFNLTEDQISKIRKNRSTFGCAFVTDIVGKYDGKSNCDEMCRKSFKHRDKNTTAGGYSVGNVNVTRSCICVTKNFYNMDFLN